MVSVYIRSIIAFFLNFPEIKASCRNYLAILQHVTLSILLLFYLECFINKINVFFILIEIFLIAKYTNVQYIRINII